MGWTVLHSLWQGALLALLLSAFRWLTARFIPQVRYWASLAALAGLFICSLGTFWWQMQVSGPAGGETVILLSGTANAAPPSYLARFTGALETRLPLLVAAWMLGMLFFALRTLGGVWYVGRLRASGQVLPEPVWQELTDQIARQMRIRRPVRLLESVRVSVPLVVGHLKPFILLPVGMVNQLTPAETEAVLAHELAHIRRHDYLINLVQSFLEVLYYFNPAVWYIAAAVRTEREHCCDDRAVAVCGNRMTYVRALVQIQEHAGAMPHLALSVLGSEKPLLQRVRRILNQPNHKKTIMERFSATLLLLAAIVAFSLSAGQPDEIPQAPEPAQAALIDQQISPDSLPPAPPKAVKQIVKEEGDRRLELTMKEGAIDEFKVNGEVVPPSDYGKYAKELEGLQADLARPHLPPPPPPPAELRLPPPPPAPGAPPAPPAPRVEKEIKVITKAGDDGRVMIWVDEENGDEKKVILFGDSIVFEEVRGEKQFLIFGEPELQLEYEILEEQEIELDRMHRELEGQARQLERQAREMERQIIIKHELAPKPPRPGGGSLKMAIESELRRDGYILPNGSYTFELSGKKLLINDKKESDVIFAKYKKIYEKHTGLTLSKDSRIEIEE